MNTVAQEGPKRLVESETVGTQSEWGQELMSLSEGQKEVIRKALGGQPVHSPIILLFGYKGEANTAAQHLADILTRMGYSTPEPGTWSSPRDIPRPADGTSTLAWDKRDIQVLYQGASSDAPKAIARALDHKLFRATGERVGVSLVHRESEEELAADGSRAYKEVLSPGNYKLEVTTNGDGMGVGVFDEKNKLIVSGQIKCSSSWNCYSIFRFTVIARQQYTLGVVNKSSSTRRFTANYGKYDAAQKPAQPGVDQEEGQKVVTRKALGGGGQMVMIFVPAGLSTRALSDTAPPNEGKNPADAKQEKPSPAQKELHKAEEKLGSELRKAAEKGQIETVRTLLEQGAAINSTDKNGRTALMFAAEKGHLEVVKLLLQRGANASATDQESESALDKARRKRKENVLALLQEEKTRRDEEETRRVKREITQFNEARMALLRKYQPLSLTEEAFLADGWTMKDAFLGRLGIVNLSSSSTTLTYRLGTFDKPKSLEAAEFVQEAFDFSRRVARSQTPFQGSWPAATVVCSLEFEKVSGMLVKFVWADR
jgi:hypothetical protein